MSRLVVRVLVLCAMPVIAVATRADAETVADYCAPPKIETAKWHLASQERGMSLMLPPGFGLSADKSSLGRGNSSLGFSPDSYRSNAAVDDAADTRLYSNGHRSIMVGGGQGPAYLTDGSTTHSSECEVTIGDRRVRITAYNWSTPDGGMQSSAESGDHYALLARYMRSGAMPEVFVVYVSSFKSDLASMRQLFWTATFNGAPMSAGVTPPSPTVSASLIAAGPGAVTPASPAPACNPDPHVPAADAIVDTATVQMLVTGSGPMAKGFALFALKFSGESLAGITVAQSDLPDPTQRQLATLVASNVRPHDPKSSAQYVLRIETQEQGLHYTVQPACIP